MEYEEMFYHAAAIRAGGDYTAIRRAKGRNATWRAAYEKLSASEHDLAPEIAWGKLRERGVQLLLREDEHFPPLLREIPHPPFGIYIRGALPENSQTAIAIVGTRRATPDGKSTARRFAAEIARAGVVVVSGLAFGVDAAAHEGCLDAGGKTIAVLACGLANIYPKNNDVLAKKIVATGGTIISEYPPDMPAYKARFLERNRIVSGLSKGALVIEAPERSGSLATARFAFEQNREVFVVPGPISHPNFRGSHALIRQGAELVTQPEDVLESCGIMKEKEIAIPFTGTSEEKAVMQFLATCAVPADIDKITEVTKLEPHIANQTVSFLLIKGAIKEVGPGYVIH